MEHAVEYTPGVRNTGWWAGREAARTPARFRDRVLDQFRSPENLAYLRRLFGEKVPPGPLLDYTLDTLHDALYEFSTAGEGRALDVLMSDPTARRGAARPALDHWTELRRLNRVFYEDRLEFLRHQAHIISPAAPRDGPSEDEEQYHMRMFISDSLRPPGLEHLNTPGPLYALREDQSTWVPRRRSGPSTPPRDGFSTLLPRERGPKVSMPFTRRSLRCEGFRAGPQQPARVGWSPMTRGAPPASPALAGGQIPPWPGHGGRAPWPGATGPAAPSGVLLAAAGARPKTGGVRATEPPVPYPYGEEDTPWSEGRANRTPEQAMAEYWGDDWVVSETATGSPETMGQAYGAAYSWGDTWKENGGTRMMRYASIPYWQKGGREGYDYDIEETLGTAGRELDAHVRRWPMDRLRDPRGQEYRRYGPRSGPIV